MQDESISLLLLLFVEHTARPMLHSPSAGRCASIELHATAPIELVKTHVLPLPDPFGTAVSPDDSLSPQQHGS